MNNILILVWVSSHLFGLTKNFSHLFFADDSIIFGQAKRRELDTISDILDCYEKASG